MSLLRRGERVGARGTGSAFSPRRSGGDGSDQSSFGRSIGRGTNSEAGTTGWKTP